MYIQKCMAIVVYMYIQMNTYIDEDRCADIHRQKNEEGFKLNCNNIRHLNV